ncbi:MAG TPA: glyoxalase [Chitinophagales bacterium]|nr:glyoxalase [Chitinophagales bacterium]
MGIQSIRPFIGAQNFELSCAFYRELGFNEEKLEEKLMVYKSGNFAFYLQNAYVKDWVDNTMVFMEVDDITAFHSSLTVLNLPSKYQQVRLSEIRLFDWGKVVYLHDPSGILWHIGEFKV